MFKEIGQFASLMKQAQGMQGRLAESKERIANLQCEGEAGNGIVKVTLSGAMRMLACQIQADLVSGTNREMLENLIVAATNQAFEKLLAAQAAEMNSITGGMDLPGLNQMLGQGG